MILTFKRLFLFHVDTHCLESSSGTHKDGEDMKCLEEITKIAVDWKIKEFPMSGHLGILEIEDKIISSVDDALRALGHALVHMSKKVFQ